MAPSPMSPLTGMVTSIPIPSNGTSSSSSLIHPNSIPKNHARSHSHSHPTGHFEPSSMGSSSINSYPNRRSFQGSLLVPGSSICSSSITGESSYPGSRRSSKDSSESASGTTVEDLVDQLTEPDYAHAQDQITKTKTFLTIYRRFLRPRDLLELFIERFDNFAEFGHDDDLVYANNARLRICSCLLHWLKNHPNDFIHRQTRQRLAAFLRERVALFPILSELYAKLLPMSSIHYFYSWRWPALSSHPHHTESRQGTDSRSSSISSAHLSTSDEDSDYGYHDNLHLEEDMDEDREWGLFDEDEALPEHPLSTKTPTMPMESLLPGTPTTRPGSPFAPGSPVSSTSNGPRYPVKAFHLTRGRRSSTGSFANGGNGNATSACAMEAFVAGRRGSASSATSNPGPFTMGLPAMFPEGDLTPLQQQMQPIAQLPYINKRSSSQQYRQRGHGSGSLSTASSTATNSTTTLSLTLGCDKDKDQQTQPLSGPAAAAATAALIFKDSMLEERIHPLQGQGKASPLSIHHNLLNPGLTDQVLSPMNIPFMDIKDTAIAAQLTFVEYGLFKKLKPRDMLRQVWKTKKGSAAFQACIAHFNFISSWVGTMILLPTKAKHRAKMMEKFISVAKVLRDMGNYNTTMAIIGAMNSSPIHRLNQTRELLQSKEIWNTFKELEHLMSSERSFYEYRSALKASTGKGPCIPYLGVHLGDLLSTSEGNKDYRQDRTLHWQKFSLMTEVISTVMNFQSEPYRIQPDPFISRVLTETRVLDDEELYVKSVATEPGKLNHSRSLSKFTFF
ncbi:hypothetical protein BGZ94_003840 [Podila epigama]|nr:hypothetical protein BGZ94_003840 [Podila epigama]